MSANAVRLALAPVKALDSGKIVTAEEAASLIRDGDTIATGGFVGIGFAEEVALAIETLYLAKGDQPVPATGKPRNLTLVYAGGQGDGNDRGLNHLRPRRSGAPRDRRALGAGAETAAIGHRQSNRGVQSSSGRDLASFSRHRSKAPGTSTHKVGLDTFVDPRHGGGKINERTKEDLVRLIEVEGEEFLFLSRITDRCRNYPRHDSRS